MNRKKYLSTSGGICKASGSGAFTLIELLVSMTILIIMTLIITKIVSDSSRAVELGYNQAMMDGNARAVFDSLLDDLNRAVAQEGMEMIVSGEQQTYSLLGTSDAISFFALLGPDAGCASTVKLVEYDVMQQPGTDFFVLRRGEECTAVGVPGSVTHKYPLMDYVVKLRIKMYSFDAVSGRFREVTSSAELPEYAEIMLMTIPDKVHRRAMRMTGDARMDYIRNNGKRYYVQATFPMANARWAEFDYR